MNRVFDTYHNLVNNLHFGRVKQKNNVKSIQVVNLETFLKKHEKKLYQLQSICLWDSPVISFGITLVITVIFYLLSYCTWKFFASLFSILLTLSVTDVWVDRIWPEIAVESPTTDDWLPVNERALSAAEITQKMNVLQEYLNKSWRWLMNLRNDKPSIFCLSTSCVLFSLVLITWSISGLTLIYTTLLCILCGPALIKRAGGTKVVQEYIDYFFAYINTVIDDSNSTLKKNVDEVVDGLVPHITEDNKNLLDIDNSSCDTHLAQELLEEKNLTDLGVSTMPAHDDASLDSLGYMQDEFDLHHGESAELSDDSDSLPASFTLPRSCSSNTSSSASLIADSKDLDDTQEYSSTSTSQSLNIGNLLSNMSKSLFSTTPPIASSSIIEPVISPQEQKKPILRRRSTDDDSEFEIIEHSDINFSS